MPNHNLTYGIILILLLPLAFSCQNLEAPVFQSIENAEIIRKSSTQVSLKAKVNFYNPNNHKITLKKAEIDVLLNDKVITNYTKDFDIRIDKFQHFSIPVEIDFSIADLNTNVITSAINALLGKKQVISYRGNIRIKAFGVRIRVPVNGTTEFNLNDL